MPDYNVALPSKPRIVSEEENRGVYEIDGLYPGYGHTLGNSLRRIILSSLPGAAITSVKIDGVNHEFSTIDGIREDVITMILNLKRVRLQMHADEPQTVSLNVSGPKSVTAADIEVPGQMQVLNPDQHIAEITGNINLSVEMTVEQGLGYLPKEVLQKEKVDIGTIALDASFTPIRRVNYEVENMRVGDRTDFNRLRFLIETDGTLTPREALEQSIDIMINQLRAIVGFKEEDDLNTSHEEEPSHSEVAVAEEAGQQGSASNTDVMKTRVEDLDLSGRTANALSGANIRTIGGLARKSEEDLLEIEGLGEKGLQEIKRALAHYGVTLK
jgi:DNA-directed RNA polymerase subunit alpha